MILRSVLTLAFLSIPSTLPHIMESGAAQVLPVTAAPVEDVWVVPRDPSQAWFVPERPTVAPLSADTQALASGVQTLNDGKFDAALRQLRSARALPPELTPYAEYYVAVAMLELGQAEAAEQRLVALRERAHSGYLNEAAALAHARAAEAQGGYQRAIRIYQDLFNGNPGQPDAVLMRMARVQFAAGEPRNSLATFARVYYEYPLSDSARDARSEIARLERALGEGPPSRTFETDFERAERLFGSRRYADALDMFEKLKISAADDQRIVMALRLAAIHLQGKRFQSALTAADPYVSSSTHQAEARYYRSSALRGLKRHDQYVAEVRRLVADYPDDPWTEVALDGLATHYVLTDNDAAAAQVFEDLYATFPKGRFAERAAWHSGWWNYRAARHAEAATTFEQAAIDFPRADYRPAYLYWAGRAREHLREPEAARALYSQDIASYQNSYYGRLARRRLTENGWSVTPVESRAVLLAASAPVAPRPSDALPNESVIRELLSASLFDDAVNELRFAARVWGPSPKIEATIAWAYHEKGELRRAINVMKRAYPSYLAAGGEALPVDVQKVLFPLDYWDLIREHSANHGLDPYLVAALIAQESTFVADIKSSANAYGLMQILPSTGRRLARAERLGAFSTKVLKNPEANIRMGTRFFASLLRRFKDSHLALASYNAGESRVVRWLAERRGLSADEFIDDIPFPETRNYVKKVLGTADDYRRLYGAAATSSE